MWDKADEKVGQSGQKSGTAQTKMWDKSDEEVGQADEKVGQSG